MNKEPCKTCGGSGLGKEFAKGMYKPCPDCEGSGNKEFPEAKQAWDIPDAPTPTGPCPRCKGTGIEPDCKPEPTESKSECNCQDCNLPTMDEIMEQPEPKEDLMFIARNIVNQLFDEACTDVDTRQRINDKCDNFVYSLLHQALARQEAENERLEEALREAGRDFYYLHRHSKDTHSDSYGFMNKVDQFLLKEQE